MEDLLNRLDKWVIRAGVEDIIRSEFSKLLPNRYGVKAGVINDQKGNTAGDFDVIIFNDH